MFLYGVYMGVLLGGGEFEKKTQKNHA